MLETIAKYVLLIVGSYLFGGIMFAKLLLKKDDITAKGSGNPGTINMLRNHGIIYGVATLLLDALKGALPALLGYFLFGGPDGGVVAELAKYIGGFFAVVGHIFPIYYDFKGGKGVATSFGFAIVASPIVIACVMVVYFIIFFTTRIGSLSSLIAVFAFIIVDTVLLILNQNYVALVFLYGIGILVFVAHRANLKRLAENKENVLDLENIAQKDVDLINSIKQKQSEKVNAKKSKQVKTEEVKVEEAKVESEVKFEEKTIDTNESIEVKEEVDKKPKTTTTKNSTTKKAGSSSKPKTSKPKS